MSAFTLSAMLLSNALLSQKHVEKAIGGGFAVGVAFLILHRVFGKKAQNAGGKIAAIFVEIQRKSFHAIGGCIICAVYYYGLKHGIFTSAYLPDAALKAHPGAMDAGAAFLSICFAVWGLEATRLMVPAVQRWYLQSFKGLIREKEHAKAAGIAYFLPGALAAMMAGPSNLAILGILFLSLGDAAASLGTAAGSIPVGCSSRKVEGSIGCFAVCSLLGLYTGLAPHIAITSAAFVSLGEVLAEVIHLDDNLVIPILGVLGVRIALAPQYGRMAAVVVSGLAVGISLALLVSSSTNKKKDEK